MVKRSFVATADEERMRPCGVRQGRTEGRQSTVEQISPLLSPPLLLFIAPYLFEPFLHFSPFFFPDLGTRI